LEQSLRAGTEKDPFGQIFQSIAAIEREREADTENDQEIFFFRTQRDLQHVMVQK
jgi:hypothetical protein